MYSILKQPPDEARADGSQWKSLLEDGTAKRQQSGIFSAITAMAFTRWHTAQVQLSEAPAKAAAEEVNRSLLRMTPTESYDRQRKYINTCLTRGKKWMKMAEELGHGVLFLDAW